MDFFSKGEEEVQRRKEEDQFSSFVSISGFCVF